jgi:hypothetical protein
MLEPSRLHVPRAKWRWILRRQQGNRLPYRHSNPEKTLHGFRGWWHPATIYCLLSMICGLFSLGVLEAAVFATSTKNVFGILVNTPLNL